MSSLGLYIMVPRHLSMSTLTDIGVSKNREYGHMFQLCNTKTGSFDLFSLCTLGSAATGANSVAHSVCFSGFCLRARRPERALVKVSKGLGVLRFGYIEFV